jgi:methyl-accepting chemotaxis protein
MAWLFDRVGISVRLFLLVALVAIGICGLLGLSYFYAHETLFAHHVAQARNLAQTANALIQVYVNEAEASPERLGDAQRRALEKVGSLRYNGKGYFWINDMNGIMLAHPITGMVGQNLTEDRDSKGKLYMKSFLELVKKQGEGTEVYYWPPQDVKQKISYFIGVPQWQWIVGTGIYFEDIEKQIRAMLIKLALAASVLLFFSLFFAILLGRSVSEPVRELTHVLSEVAVGNIDVDVALAQRGDEIGAMAKTTRVFVEHAKRVARMDAEKAEIDKAKNEFISVVSHELRTPLTSIRGSVDLILGTMKNMLPEKAVYLLTVAQSNMERLMLLINDLLDLDKAAAGEMRLEIQTEKIGVLLAQAAEMNKAYAEKYYNQISCSWPFEEIKVRVDKGRFLQILSNLLSNAAKFSPAGDKFF